MTTQRTTWTEYTGSDEQIAEMKHGFIFRDVNGQECKLIYYANNFVSDGHLKNHLKQCEVTHYWLILADPLREMKVRQAMTGQPVWARRYSKHYEKWVYYDGTTKPDWTLPNAEYSFTPFE